MVAQVVGLHPEAFELSSRHSEGWIAIGGGGAGCHLLGAGGFLESDLVAFLPGLGLDDDFDLFGRTGGRFTFFGRACRREGGVFCLGDFDVEKRGEKLRDSFFAAAGLQRFFEHPRGVLILPGDGDLAGRLDERDGGDDFRREAQQLRIAPRGRGDLEDARRFTLREIPGQFPVRSWQAHVNAVFDHGGCSEPAFLENAVLRIQKSHFVARFFEPGLRPFVVVELAAVDALDPFDGAESENQRGDFFRVRQIVEGGFDLPGGAVAEEDELGVLGGDDLDPFDLFFLQGRRAALDLAQLDGGGKVALDAEDQCPEGGDEKKQDEGGSRTHGMFFKPSASWPRP